MSAANSHPFLRRYAAMIVDHRRLITAAYVLLLIACFFTRGLAVVENDIIAYLDEGTETRRGLELMDSTFTTYGTARVMLANTTLEKAQAVCTELEQVEGVYSAEPGITDPTEGASTEGDDGDTTTAKTPEEMAGFMQGADALITVTFSHDEDDPRCEAAMDGVKAVLASRDAYIDSKVGFSVSDELAQEVALILAVIVPLVIIVLILTSHSYADVAVLLLVFLAVALLNVGTHFLMGTISFVSNSVSGILQLALAIDYAVIFINRFALERQQAETRTAVINATVFSVPAILSSSLTTIGGLSALLFMHFGIGPDLGRVLIKAIAMSLITVFTLMPCLLIYFDRAIAKTRHRPFISTVSGWGRLVVYLRRVTVPVFLIVMVIAAPLSLCV